MRHDASELEKYAPRRYDSKSGNPDYVHRKEARMICFFREKTVALGGLVLSVLLGLGSPDHSSAAPMIFTDETGFQGAASSIPLSLETFDAAVNGAFTSKTFGDLTLSANQDLLGLASSILWIGSGINPLTIAFAQPVNSFGIDISGLGNGSSPTTFSISLDSGAFSNVFTNYSDPTGSDLFVGVVDTASKFSSVTFSNTAAGDGVFLDDAQFGVIPAPSALLLLISSLVGFRIAKGRRCRKA